MLHCSAVLFVNNQGLVTISRKMAQFLFYFFKTLIMEAIKTWDENQVHNTPLTYTGVKPG